jgi:hypothetical protein
MASMISRLGDIQQVVILAQVLGVVSKLGAAELGFAQSVGLNHGAHGAVQNYNALLEKVEQG